MKVLENLYNYNLYVVICVFQLSKGVKAGECTTGDREQILDALGFSFFVRLIRTSECCISRKKILQLLQLVSSNLLKTNPNAPK